MSQSENIQFVFLLVIGVAITISVLTNKRHLNQPLFQYAAAWVAIFLVLLIAYSFKEKISEQLFPSKVIAENGEFKVRKSSDGHYHIDVYINSKKIRFMVDTGASDMVLTLKDASDIGIPLDSLQFDKVYNTANGTISAASITLTSVVVGNTEFQNVKAAINSADMGSSLLGMSFLERFEYYKFENDELILKPSPTTL